jgi:hypothetical protein
VYTCVFASVYVCVDMVLIEPNRMAYTHNQGSRVAAFSSGITISFTLTMVLVNITFAITTFGQVGPFIPCTGICFDVITSFACVCVCACVFVVLVCFVPLTV